MASWPLPRHLSTHLTGPPGSDAGVYLWNTWVFSHELVDHGTTPFVTDAILPGVVCCSHGWWEACEELGMPGFDPFSEAGANQNLLVLNDQRDPISGGTPHRSTLCRIGR